ncbi:MAG: hypothetical protein ACYTG0_29205, partial [Planctomycetota bacterium]
MPIDPYSLCPGGTGKKIKFCCSDLLGDLDKIQRMLEGEQYQACLKHVERLLQSHADRACLLATQTMLLRVLNRIDDSKTAATAFLEKHPESPLALADMALAVVVSEGGCEALAWIQRAIVASGTQVPPRVYEAMGVVSRVLASEGEFMAARALVGFQVAIYREDQRTTEFLVQLNSSPAVPLVFKEDQGTREAPADVPWKAAFDEAVDLSARGQTARAAERLTELTEQGVDDPAVWRNLAAMRGRLADTPGCIEALGRFTSLDVSLDEAVEAETLCRFLSEDPLGDQIDRLTLTCVVGDVERFEAAFSATPQVTQLQGEFPPPADDEPPPKSVYLLCEDGSPEADAQTVRRILCQAFLFGKQTDREARLEVLDVAAPDLDLVEALLAEAVGDDFASSVEQEVTGEVSATLELLNRRWRLPEGAQPEEARDVAVRQVDRAVLRIWLKSPLALLDGKSPEEAAGDAAYRVRLLAAVSVLEFWLEQLGSRFDLNRLREQLGLPVPEPIDPE